MITELGAGQKVFLPLTINRKLWDHGSTMIFLNQVYCEQLDEAERLSLRYDVCDSPLPVKDQDFQDRIKAIAACIGRVLSEHGSICEDRGYWEKLFFRWLLYIVYDIQVKRLQFEALKKNYPDQTFYTHTKKEFLEKDFFEGDVQSLWEDDYHLWLYTYMAKEYFGVHVIPVEVEDQTVDSPEEKEKDKGFLRPIFRKMKKVFTESPRHTLRRGMSYYYRTFSRDKAEVLYYGLDISSDTSITWLIGSSGKIQPFTLASRQINASISPTLRRKLTLALGRLGTVSPVIADIIGRTLPKLYLEEYEYHHVRNMSLLKQYRRLKVVFSLTGILSSCPETIFSLLAQKRGVKVIGLQHGGDYEVINGILDQEEYLNDVFYSWSGKETRPCSTICEILSAPSYKFNRYRCMQGGGKYVLFVGTSLFMYPRYDEYKGEDVFKIRYIRRQMEFFSALEQDSRNDLYVKEYYVDSGWHILSTMEKAFPLLKFIGRNKIAPNYGVVDIIDRNTSFAEALMGCKLMICDHLSTTWREALYLNKPFLMLLDRETWSFREEALESVRLMESVGIILYDCEEAATLLNRIHGDVSGWWNEPERQAVIKRIRKNYLFEVEDIDGWWMRELLRQARS